MPRTAANETQIVIDGDPSDWGGQPVVATDRAGDGDGFFDMQSIRMFINQDALYILIEGDTGSGTSDIQLDFVVETPSPATVWMIGSATVRLKALAAVWPSES